MFVGGKRILVCCRSFTATLIDSFIDNALTKHCQAAAFEESKPFICQSLVAEVAESSHNLRKKKKGPVLKQYRRAPNDRITVSETDIEGITSRWRGEIAFF